MPRKWNDANEMKVRLGQAVMCPHGSPSYQGGNSPSKGVGTDMLELPLSHEARRRHVRCYICLSLFLFMGIMLQISQNHWHRSEQPGIRLSCSAEKLGSGLNTQSWSHPCPGPNLSTAHPTSPNPKFSELPFPTILKFLCWQSAPGMNLPFLGLLQCGEASALPFF